MNPMIVTSPEFRHNGFIPRKYTCQGWNANPELRIEAIPEVAESLVLIMKDIFWPALLLAIIFLFMKPWIFKIAFMRSGEKKAVASEIGLRLGQLSEFSLLIAILAFDLGVISDRASQLIQLTTIMTFVASSYWVVFKFPTPIGTKASLTKD